MYHSTSKPPIGGAYFTVAAWTAAGERPEQCVWRGDQVDHQRLREGRVFDSRDNAVKSMKDG